MAVGQHGMLLLMISIIPSSFIVVFSIISYPTNTTRVERLIVSNVERKQVQYPMKCNSPPTSRIMHTPTPPPSISHKHKSFRRSLDLHSPNTRTQILPFGVSVPSISLVIRACSSVIPTSRIRDRTHSIPSTSTAPLATTNSMIMSISL